MMMMTHDDILRRRVTTHDDNVQWHHTMTNNNGWWQRWLLSAAESYYCKPRFDNLLILQTYDFNSNDKSNFSNVPVTKHGAQTAAPKLIQRLLVQRRGCVGWVKGRCPLHQYPSFTRCHIHRSAHPPFTNYGTFIPTYFRS